MTLTQQQERAIDKFKRLKVGALFMQQGTGKTRVAIELANTTDCELVVFIVPAALCKNLKNELDKWSLDKEYIIETYQGIVMSDRRYIELLSTMKDKRCMIIADESTFIKNDSSKTYRRIMELQKFSEYRLILNGTPITKSEWDIYNQMSFLSEKILKMTRHEFLNTFFTHVKYKKRGEREKEFYKFSEINADYLHNLIKPYIFQADLEFLQEEKTSFIEINSYVKEEYAEYKKQLIETLREGINGVGAILRKMEYLMFTDTDRIAEIATYISGQCIVFCQFVSEINDLASRLKRCYVIKGDVPKEERDEILRQFREDDVPLLITLGTGAFGLNLQFCNRIMFSSISFNYANIEQAIFRIKRIGQERNIEYTFFRSSLGLYQMIYQNLERKKTLRDIVVEKLDRGDKVEKIL